MKARATSGSRTFFNSGAGFTLIESLVAIAILAVFAALAAPNLNGAIANIRIKSISFDLVNDLITARSEAIKRNSNVTISANDANWNEGWSIVTGSTAIKSHDGVPSNIQIAANVIAITFQGNGRPDPALADPDIDDPVIGFDVTSTAQGVTSRCIELRATGSARSLKGACPL